MRMLYCSSSYICKGIGYCIWKHSVHRQVLNNTSGKLKEGNELILSLFCIFGKWEDVAEIIPLSELCHCTYCIEARCFTSLIFDHVSIIYTLKARWLNLALLADTTSTRVTSSEWVREAGGVLEWVSEWVRWPWCYIGGESGGQVSCGRGGSLWKSGGRGALQRYWGQRHATSTSLTEHTAGRKCEGGTRPTHFPLSHGKLKLVSSSVPRRVVGCIIVGYPVIWTREILAELRGGRTENEGYSLSCITCLEATYLVLINSLRLVG